MAANEVILLTFSFAGGVALFLLGMKLLTDGLKIAAGESLRNLLGKYTSTIAKGVASGILVTALVQSSSAVIFATIGFVNAGVMTLAQAIYVIFGSNVGTTLTGWIIASVGLKINLQLFAMPFLAVGMGLWLSGGGSRRGAWGQALTGFSIFFLGIDVLKTAFSDLGEFIPFDSIDQGWRGNLLMLLVGVMMTTMMQSSSAAIAVVLTATAGGVIPVQTAAFMVIGADIGTTSTAVLAVYGATSNAKRTASAHVLFNVVNGLVVILLLPWYLAGIDAVFGAGITVATTIALFHTMKKLTGLIIMLPFVGWLEHYLLQKFRDSDVQPEKTRYLDNTVLGTPSLAVSALIFELKRVGRKTRRLVNGSIKKKLTPDQIERQRFILEGLHQSVGDYIQKMQSSDFPEDLQHTLPEGLRVLAYFRESMDVAAEIRALTIPIDDVNPALQERLAALEADVRQICKIADSEKEGFDIQEVEQLVIAFQQDYEKAKQSLLHSGSRGKLTMNEMLHWHDYIRGLRRIIDQLSKAARHMDAFNQLIEHTPGEGPALMEAMHQN
jgi:phosphate:Na+ symporter